MALATLEGVEDVRAVDHWRLWVRFEDGVEGEVDVSDLRDSPMFAALHDRSFFDTGACLHEGREMGRRVGTGSLLVLQDVDGARVKFDDHAIPFPGNDYQRVQRKGTASPPPYPCA